MIGNVDVVENPFLEKRHCLKAYSNNKPVIIVGELYAFMLMGGSGKIKFEDRLDDCFALARNRVSGYINERIEKRKV